MVNQKMRYDKFRDPIHGFIEVRPLEEEIIDSAPFQRLRNIKQLALTSYIYYGAEHTRFGHSIGVMHLATKAFRSAVSKERYQFDQGEENDKCIKWLEQILRLVALTHDLGHAPFSHAAEGLFPEMATKTGTRKKYYKHEDLTEKIIKQTEIAGFIKAIGEQYKSELGEKYDITPDLICDVYNGNNAGQRSQFTFLKTFMDSELDCDKMDYLLRDSHYCGVMYGKYDIDRLISCLTIFRKDRGDEAPYLGIQTGGIQAFEGFVLARYFMFVQVYFHRTRRFFDIILSDALRQCLPGNSFPIDVQEYLKWDDVKVLDLLRENVETYKSAKDIISRRHWTCVYTTKTHPQGEGIELFKTIERTLKRKFTPENYKTDFLVDTSADKLPHKIVPRKHAIDDEETIAIVDESRNKVSTISDESHIINNLTEKINIQRIYASDRFAADAKAEVSLLTGNEEEECERIG